VRLAIALGIVAAARVASAFPSGTQFDLDPMMGDGGGGNVFDGAPRFTAHGCDVCHTDPPHRIGEALQADHPELFTDGYKPGMQYHLRVVLENEWAGIMYKSLGDNCGFAATTYVPCDQNGFALEVDDLNGNPQGSYTAVVDNACATGTPPPGVDVYIMLDGNAVTHNGAHHAQSQWDFCWTAPAAGKGVLTAYLAVVDGNGGDGTMNFPANTTGDDVVTGTLPMAEIGGAAAPTQSGGCSAGGDAGGAVALIVLALVAPRRRTRWLAALLALGAISGCAHVRPRERETLARRNMKFGPDPIEDELDLHMQEAREGSSGGYGSSGGGCGCN